MSIEVVFEIPFFTFNNADILFVNQKLTWKTYTTKEALPTIQRVELIDKKKFARAVLDENIEVFVVYVAFLILKMIIH